MGRVADEVLGKVRRAVETKGLVVWFDPTRRFTSLLDVLASEHISVLRGEDGYFDLRWRLEPWLSSETRPRGVVWVPAPAAEGRRALCEVCAAAAVLGPDAPSRDANTSLAVALRAVLPAGLASAARNALVSQAERTEATLAEVDALAEHAGEGDRAALAAVFRSTDREVIALRFAATAQHDDTLASRGLLAPLAALLGELLGDELRLGDDGVAALRARFCARAWALAWRARFAPEDDALVSTRLLQWFATWRNQRDLRDAYVERARAIEPTLGALPPSMTVDALAAAQEFSRADDMLRATLMTALDEAPDEALEARCVTARRGFWAEVEPGRTERWSLLEATARVLRLAIRVDRELLASGEGAGALAARYAEGMDPWCALDTAHRHMERWCHTADLELDGADAPLDALAQRARRRYAEVTDRLARRWVRSLVADGGAAGLLRQREVYARVVRPASEEGAVAYVLVDGLRYEMARELAASLADLGEVSLRPALGALPSITEIGMASLLPGADESVSLSADRHGNLGLLVRSKHLRQRKDRVAHLASEVPGVTVIKIGDLVPSRRAVREEVGASPFVVVTVTDELDGLGDGVNPQMARRAMDDVLPQLRRAVRALFQRGVRAAVLTSDHGHFFGDPLGSDATLPAPGGETVALHRRAWVGRGGAASPGTVRFRAAELGYTGDLEVIVPEGMGCFAAAGPIGGYFHGGASPQELLVPVLTVRALASPSTSGAATWTLRPSRPRLSAMVASFAVEASVLGILPERARRVRLEIREGRRALGRVWQAAEGFDPASGEVAMRYDTATRTFGPNTLTVRLDEAPKGRRVRAVLLDAATDVELAEVELDATLGAY